jgi:hypothetical protein
MKKIYCTSIHCQKSFPMPIDVDKENRKFGRDREIDEIEIYATILGSQTSFLTGERADRIGSVFTAVPPPNVVADRRQQEKELFER